METPTLSINLSLPINLLIVGAVLNYFGNENGIRASKAFFAVGVVSLLVVSGYGIYKYNQDKKALNEIQTS